MELEELSAHKEFDPPGWCQTGLWVVVAVPGNGNPGGISRYRDLAPNIPCLRAVGMSTVSTGNDLGR